MHNINYIQENGFMGIRVMMVGGDAYQNAMRFNYIHERLNVIVVALC